MQYWQFWIALVGVLVMAGGLGGMYYLIIRQNAVLGNKAIQFVSIIFILPLLLVLGVVNALRAETIGVVVGVIIGFVLSNFTKE